MTADFASTAMVNILSAGMRRLGMKTPEVTPYDATVSLAFKRELVSSAIAQGGWRALPRLGEGVEAIRGQPLYQALVSSNSPADLLARWTRMERYVHSRHRIQSGASARGFRVQHVSLQAGESPLPQESLVVLGVLACALQEAGFGPVTASVDGCTLYPGAEEAQVLALRERGQLGSWDLECASGERRNPRHATTPETLNWPQVPQPLQALRQRLLSDLVSPMSLAQAAAWMAASTRTLQRQLAEHRLSYSHLVDGTRCDAAAWHLVNTELSLAEIGFVCGFSDQAHFGRNFRRRCAITPATYRREFGLELVG